jgi:hypothetical protein
MACVRMHCKSGQQHTSLHPCAPAAGRIWQQLQWRAIPPWHDRVICFGDYMAVQELSIVPCQCRRRVAGVPRQIFRVFKCCHPTAVVVRQSTFENLGTRAYEKVPTSTANRAATPAMQSKGLYMNAASFGGDVPTPCHKLRLDWSHAIQ